MKKKQENKQNTKTGKSPNSSKKKSAVETGDFGPIYRQFKGRPVEAIKHLKKVKKGECIAALHRDEIGDIDIVWGQNDPNTNRGYGLKHIIEKHGKEIKDSGYKIEEFIPMAVEHGEFNDTRSKSNKRVFSGNNYRFVVVIDNKNKRWLLTAFTVKKPLKKNKGFRRIL